VGRVISSIDKAGHRAGQINKPVGYLLTLKVWLIFSNTNNTKNNLTEHSSKKVSYSQFWSCADSKI